MALSLRRTLYLAICAACAAGSVAASARGPSAGCPAWVWRYDYAEWSARGPAAARYAPPRVEGRSSLARRVADAPRNARRCSASFEVSDAPLAFALGDDGDSVSLHRGSAAWRAPALRAGAWRRRGNVQLPVPVLARGEGLTLPGVAELEHLAVVEVSAAPLRAKLASYPLMRLERRAGTIVARAILSGALFLDMARDCAALGVRRDVPSERDAASLRAGTVHRVGVTPFWERADATEPLGELFSVEGPVEGLALVEAFDRVGERVRVRIPTDEGAIAGWVWASSLGAEIPDVETPLAPYADTVFYVDERAGPERREARRFPARVVRRYPPPWAPTWSPYGSDEAIGTVPWDDPSFEGGPRVSLSYDHELVVARVPANTALFASWSWRRQVFARTGRTMLAELRPASEEPSGDLTVVRLGGFSAEGSVLYVRARDIRRVERGGGDGE